MGKFNPSILKTSFEVGYHIHLKDEVTRNHYHKKSDEINLVVNGLAEIKTEFGQHNVKKGDIFVVPKGAIMTLKSLVPKTEVIVVKTKSIKGDKHYV